MFARHRLNPIYSLVGAVVFLLGWCNMMWIWFSCASDDEGGYDMCYQRLLEFDPNTDYTGSRVGVSDGVTQAMLAFGILVLVTYVLHQCHVFAPKPGC